MDTIESSESEYMQWVKFPEDDELPTDVTTKRTASLVQPNNVPTLNHFYSSEQMMRSRFVEDAGASRPMSLPFNAALHSGYVAEYPKPLPFDPRPVNTHLWPHGAPVMGLHESPSPVGLGLSLPASACPYVCPSTGLMCVQTHRLVSEAAWDEAAGYRRKDDVDEIQPSTEIYSLAVNHLYGSSTVPSQVVHQEDQRYLYNGDLSRAQPLNIAETGTLSSMIHPLLHVPSPATYPSLQGPSFYNTLACLPGPAHHPQCPVLPTPSATSLPTPDSSVASIISSPRSTTFSIPTFSPRRKRRHRSTLGSSMAPKGIAALGTAREGVRKFVRDHPRNVEPSIGDPAAMAIIGANPNVGIPGKSIYSAFFSRSGKSQFTCYECGHVEARFSRAVHHQRQEHFQHHPFRCGGGTVAYGFPQTNTRKIMSIRLEPQHSPVSHARRCSRTAAIWDVTRGWLITPKH